VTTHRIITWDEYCELSEEDQRHVTVVTFTGLTDCGTLKEQPIRSEHEGTLGSGGRENRSSARRSRSKS